MHAHLTQEEFLEGIAAFLGSYYLVLALANAAAALCLWRKGRTLAAGVWLGVSLLAGAMSLPAYSGRAELMAWISLPPAVCRFVNAATGAVTFSAGTLVGLIVLFVFRRFFVKPLVAWTGLNLAALALGLSLTNMHFARIVGRPDNVPIVGMVFLLGFFVWLGARRAVENDDRARQGEVPHEKLDDQKVLVWPDLVYIELICMVLLTAALIAWAILLPAPLEGPANAVQTPNPSKAPWYFVGLQEMLGYFEAWNVGVVVPGLILFGLMAIPYLDFNPKGNGYYTIGQRKFAYLTFHFGFFLWIMLILLGTFLRGPNWAIFGPFEPWDPNKIVVRENVNLSDFFWGDVLRRAPPVAREGASWASRTGSICLRESPGILALALYYLGLPPLLARTVFRKFYAKMGLARYTVLSLLLLLMASLPIKMVLCWTTGLHYIVSIPEYFLNY